MSQQVIGVGTAANDGTGDPARTAFQKANANFTELYAADATLTAAVAGKAASSHTHAMSDVTGLEGALGDLNEFDASVGGAVGDLQAAIPTLAEKAANLSDLTDPAAARGNLGFVSHTTLGTTGAVAIDAAANTSFVLSLTGNVTLSLTNEADGRRFTLYLRGQASGYSVTWWAGIKWAGGAAPTIPTTAGRVLPVAFVRLAAGEWLGIPAAECY